MTTTMFPTDSVRHYRQGFEEMSAKSKGRDASLSRFDAVFAGTILEKMEGACRMISASPEESVDEVLSRRLSNISDGWREYIRRHPADLIIAVLRCEFEAGMRDDFLLWVLAIEDVMAADNDFGCRYFEALSARDIRNVEWLVAAACWVLSTSGFDPSQTLRGALTRLESNVDGFRSYLRTSSGSPGTHEAMMAEFAIAVLNGRSLVQCPTPGWWPLSRT